MAKIPFQDVVPPHQDGPRRSIRNIPINTRRSRREDPKIEEPRVEENQPVFNNRYNPVSTPEELEKFSPRKRKFFTPKVYLTLIGLAILAFIFIMMDAFTSANILITPKKDVTSFNMAITVADAQNASSTASLHYEVIPLTGEKHVEVQASGVEDVSRKASVKVMLYNNYSTSPERLIARTRLETPEGLIFRIQDAVVIPGKTSKPGSIEVTAYADEPGDKYNVGLKDFTIPGFKGDSARFKNIYGRSIAAASGGFVGKAKKVSDADRQSAIAQLEASIKDDAEKQLDSKLDPNLIVLKGAIIYDFTELPQDDSGENPIIKVSVNASAIAFNKQEISNLVEKQYLKSWGDLPGSISSYDNVTLTFDDPSWRPSKSGSASVKIAGSADFTANIDKAGLAESLAGKSKNELSNVINASRAIESAKSSVRPVWKQYFPGNPSKINIEINP